MRAKAVLHTSNDEDSVLFAADFDDIDEALRLAEECLSGTYPLVRMMLGMNYRLEWREVAPNDGSQIHYTSCVVRLALTEPESITVSVISYPEN